MIKGHTAERIWIGFRYRVKIADHSGTADVIDLSKPTPLLRLPCGPSSQTLSSCMSPNRWHSGTDGTVGRRFGRDQGDGCRWADCFCAGIDADEAVTRVYQRLPGEAPQRAKGMAQVGAHGTRAMGHDLMCPHGPPPACSIIGADQPP